MNNKAHHYLASTDDTQQLHYIVWTPEASAPHAVLQLVHGMEEYIDRYDVLARYLNQRGWAVIGHDHLGHGLSGRVAEGTPEAERSIDNLSQRGYFTDRTDGADVVIADMHLLTQEAKRRWPGLPVFIMGHSMGSFFLRRYLALHADSVSGAVICGTGWYNALLTGIALIASHIVGRLCGWHTRSTLLRVLTSPHALAFRSEGEGAWLSRNPDNVQRFMADPLCGFGFTAGGYRVMYRNLLHVSLAHDYQRIVTPIRSGEKPADYLPLLILSGADDSVGGTKAVRRVAEQYRSLGLTDVTELIFPADRHEVLFEPDAPAVHAALADWLDARAKGDKPKQ